MGNFIVAIFHRESDRDCFEINNDATLQSHSHNQRTVYNHKRHGEFKLGNKNFSFRVKPHFPKKVTPEFLLVDLVNNLDRLAEDQNELLKNISSKVRIMDSKKLKRSVQEYGNAKTKRTFEPLMSV